MFTFSEAMVKLYCPKCMDVYTPKSSRHHHTDGAYFGTGFPHMLFMVHPEYRPKRPANQFVPRLYGFKIHHLAYQVKIQVIQVLNPNLTHPEYRPKDRQTSSAQDSTSSKSTTWHTRYKNWFQWALLKIQGFKFLNFAENRGRTLYFWTAFKNH